MSYCHFFTAVRSSATGCGKYRRIRAFGTLRSPHIVAVCTVIALMTISHYGLCKDRVFYRYINEQGVKVLAHSIPAQYIAKGYEIIDANGQLIEVIAPELSPEAKAQAAALQAEKEKLQVWDRQLLRRYSNIGDIEAAKTRKLAGISANINILHGNIAHLNSEIDKLQAQAAAIERSGQPVSSTILEKINDVQQELAATADRIDLRLQQYQMQIDKFNKDIERFLIIEDGRKPEASAPRSK